MQTRPTVADTIAPVQRARPRLGPRQIARSKLLIVLSATISFALSVSLWFTGHESQGLFVGLWVPSILSFGSLMLAGPVRDQSE